MPAITSTTTMVPETRSGRTSNSGAVTGSNTFLAPLGYYGGTTQTMMPLPGSAAICAGTAANATAASLTTDQRGNPRSTTAYSSTACVDAGAVQTAYSLQFSATPSDPQHSNVAFTPVAAVQLLDNSTAINLAGAPISMALNSGVLNGTASQNTGSTGVATFNGLSVATATKLSNDSLTASASAGPYTITAQSSSFDVVALILPAATLPDAQAGVSYSSAIAPATGGTAPIAYAITGGHLPNGLNFNTTSGAITGTPTEVGTAFSFTVTATDSANNTAQQTYTLNVTAPAIVISPTTAALTAGTYGVSYSQSVTASGGTAPYTYSVSAGSLPTGLSLNANTGAITGTPTAANSATPYTFTITATDSTSGAGSPFSASRSYTLTINKATPVVTLTVPSTQNPTFTQNAVTFTATVSFAAGAGTTLTGPTGTVAFTDTTTTTVLCATAALGTYNATTGMVTASCTVNDATHLPLLAAGAHTIAASYSGDTNFFAGTNPTLTENVADFTISMQNATFTVVPGSVATYTFSIIPVGATTVFPAVVNFSVDPSTLPAGYTATFTPSSVGPCNPIGATCPGTVTLNIQTVLATAANHPASGLTNKLTPLALALLLLPFAGRLRKAGRRFGRMVSVILLMAAGAAALAGVSGCGSDVGFFGQAQQSHTITVTGTSGTLSRSANITLTVE